MGNQEKLATQDTQDEDKRNSICVGHHYSQANTNNVSKTWALLQTTGGKDEPNIVFNAIIHIHLSEQPLNQRGSPTLKWRFPTRATHNKIQATWFTGDASSYNLCILLPDFYFPNQSDVKNSLTKIY